jgi:hypothetical protein
MEKTEMDNSTATSTTSISWYRTSILHIEGEASAWYRPFIRSFTGAAGTANGEIETQSWTPEADGCPRSSTVDDSSGNGFQIAAAREG